MQKHKLFERKVYRHIGTIGFSLFFAFSNFLFSCFALAGSNESTTFSKKGSPLKMQFVGTAQGPKGELMLEGLGRTMIDEKVITSLPVAEISATSIHLTGDGGPVTFHITPGTRFCNKGKAVKPDFFQVGDKVLVSSREDETTALSVQKGPIYFLLSPGGAQPVYKDCPSKGGADRDTRARKKGEKKAPMAAVN